MPPTLANGKICYIEIPATDVQRSADFYQQVFGWNIRRRGNGAAAFDDPTGEVSGTWVVGRPAAASPGLLFYIMVDSVAATVDEVVAHGGEIVQPIGADAPEITARFRDLGGNVIALYQEPDRVSPEAPSQLDVLRTHGYNGVDARGAKRRNPARDDADRSHHQGHADQRDRVVRRDPEQQPLNDAAREQGPRDAQHEANRQ